MPTEWYRERQYRDIGSTQVTISTAATQIVPAQGNRMQIDICMLGTQAIYIGTSSVTVGSGAYLVGTVGAALGIYTDQAVYAICSAGTVPVSVFESLSS